MKATRLFHFKISFWGLISVFFFMLFVSTAGFCADEALDSLTVKEINMLRGELVTIKVYSLTRISVESPGFADVISADTDKILLVAKQPGTTNLFIWDEHGKRTIVVNVQRKDLHLAKQRLEKIFKEVFIDGLFLTINNSEGKVVITGELPLHKYGQYEKIITRMQREGFVLDLVTTESIKDLIQVDMQVMEVGSTYINKMGIDWTAGSGGGISLSYPETLPSTDGSIGDLFKIGEFNRNTSFVATVNALIKEGKGRVLSKPSLVVVSGQDANFNVGGEVPIKTTTVTDGGTVENISFKKYGVGVGLTPTIYENNKIDIRLEVTVSDVDATSPTGVSDVAFISTSAQTRLLLDNKQTIVMAGLIKKIERTSYVKVPFLGSIPIIGMLFRSKDTPGDSDTEIVISLTPTILRKNRSEFWEKNLDLKEEQMDADKAIEEGLPVGLQDAQEESAKELSNELSLEIPSDDALMPEDLDNDIMPMTDISELQPEEKQDVSQKQEVSEAVRKYVSNVKDKISKAIHFPEEAQKEGWEGTVKIELLILQDGTLAFALVKESSGYDVFDEDARKTAKNLAPYDPFPANMDLQELNVTIPIVYHLSKK